MRTPRKTSRSQVPAFRWVRLAPLQHRRYGASATVLKDGRVLVQGGHFLDSQDHNRRVCPPDETWDPRTGAWSPSPTPATTNELPEREVDWSTKAYGRPAPTLTPLGDGRILVTGGKEPGTAAGGWEVDPEPFKDAFIVDPGSRKKTPAGTLCVARWIHATAVLPDGSVLLIGGADRVCSAIPDVEIGLPPNFAASRILRAQVAGFQEQLRLQRSNGLIHDAGRARHRKRYADALKLARQAVALTPRHEDAWKELGGIYSELGRHEEALVEYRRLLSRDPSSPFLWFSVAHCLLRLERRREALDAYVKVLERVDAEGEDFTTRAIREQARKQRQYLTLDLEGPEAGLKGSAPAEEWSTEEWNNRGMALVQLGRAAEALSCLDRALQLDPRNDVAWYNRGAALLSLKRPKEARVALEKSIALRGDRAASALIAHGVACYDLGDFAESVKSYDRALQLGPEGSLRVNAWTNRGNSLLKMKEYDRAGESYGKALKVDPKFASAWHGKACVASALGRYPDVRAALEKVFTLAPAMEAGLRGDEDLAAYWAWERQR